MESSSPAAIRQATATIAMAISRPFGVCRCCKHCWRSMGLRRNAFTGAGSPARRLPSGRSWYTISPSRCAPWARLTGSANWQARRNSPMPQNGKLKLGLYWAASCGGCEIAIVELRDKILDLDAAAEILFWPVALDYKYKDVEAMLDGHIDVCLFNGAIRSTENEQVAHLLRRKSKVLVAFGSCAHLGGIPGLANLFDRQSILGRAYL